MIYKICVCHLKFSWAYGNFLVDEIDAIDKNSEIEIAPISNK